MSATQVRNLFLLIALTLLAVTVGFFIGNDLSFFDCILLSVMSAALVGYSATRMPGTKDWQVVLAIAIAFSGGVWLRYISFHLPK